jgi:hypothetical protein
MKNVDKVLDAIKNRKCGAFGSVTVWCFNSYVEVFLHGHKICQMWFPDSLGHNVIRFSCCGYNTNTTKKRYLNAILEPYGHKLSNINKQLNWRKPGNAWQEISDMDSFEFTVDGEKYD